MEIRSGGELEGRSGGGMTASNTTLLLSGVQPVVEMTGLEPGGGGGGGGGEVDDDMRRVLSDLTGSTTTTSSLTSVLHPAAFTTEDLGEVIGTSGVTTDPESLRFQYPLAEPTPPKKKTTPTVYREQDRFLPINNVSRVMRNAIPRNGKVSKDAKECMQECVSEFVSFITSEAADRCSQEKRKTLTGDDILFAMANLGFDNYIQPMKLYLQKIREYTKVEKSVPNTVASGASGAEVEEESELMVLQPPPLPLSSSLSPQ